MRHQKAAEAGKDFPQSPWRSRSLRPPDWLLLEGTQLFRGSLSKLGVSEGSFKEHTQAPLRAPRGCLPEAGPH